MARSKDFILDILKLADIKVGGKRPQDIQVTNDRFYSRVMKDGVLGLGEAYLDEWWAPNDMYVSFRHVFAAQLDKKLHLSASMILAGVDATLRNHQTVKAAKKNAEHHYNIGNDLYELMLDKRMVYSCGYWNTAKNLDDAQTQKLDLICRKLELKKGMTVLDIGCGWGGFLAYAAKNYGIKGVGITPALEQVKIARERTKDLDVTIKQLDYREVQGKFDRIVSVGSFEHIGYKNHKTFFEVCDKRLKKDGMMLHHFIGGNADTKKIDPWTGKYIFPGGLIPGLRQLTKATEGKFIIEDLHNFGPDYDRTLREWHKNFVKSYPKLKDKYDDRFYRMWEFYLLLSAASFKERELQLWQFVMRRKDSKETYRGVR